MTEYLKSWHETTTKHAILDFVAAVSDEDDPAYVTPEERIAVFDNDGTLWCEKPMYIQFDYLLRKLAAQAESDPALRTELPWKAAWEKDFDWLGGCVTKHYRGDDTDFKILLKGILSLSEGQLVESIEAEAKLFVENEYHPTLGRVYSDCTYQPMLELLRYLETKDFTNYIVSGGGRDFVRGIVTDLYGIPRERAIGSTVAYRFEEYEENNQIVQKAALDVVDDGPGKPIQIWNVIGRRPILAAGNSNGDLQMMKFAGGDSLPALRLLVVHDDPEREFDYVSGAEKAIEAVKKYKWTTISIRRDWQQVFPD
jgi:phosphoglycolate phosphatase-like HAD superfamily hydrolase